MTINRWFCLQNQASSVTEKTTFDFVVFVNIFHDSIIYARDIYIKNFGCFHFLPYLCKVKVLKIGRWKYDRQGNDKINMDVAFLLDKYFKDAGKVSIDVFDAQTLNSVYKDVITAMTSHFEIEVSVLQALSYCLYEMMDNVHIHSGKPLGTAMTYYDSIRKSLSILIADDGMGVRASLSENEKYKEITEAEALKMCLEDKITDGKGLGFGLFTTSRLVDSIGKEFVLHSGSHKLIIKDGETTVVENGFWQGTLIYMVIGTGVEIDPNQIVDHRAERSVLVALQRRYKVISESVKTTD